MCISPSSIDLFDSDQGARGGLLGDPHRPLLEVETLDDRDNSAPVMGAMASAIAQQPVVSGTRRNISFSSREAVSLGLACEWYNLNTVGLPPGVIDTIQIGRALSTRSLDGSKWSVFEKWCTNLQGMPLQWSVTVILAFIQDLLDKEKAFSTIKVYLEVIPACYVGFEGKTVGSHPVRLLA